MRLRLFPLFASLPADITTSQPRSSAAAAAATAAARDVTNSSSSNVAAAKAAAGRSNTNNSSGLLSGCLRTSAAERRSAACLSVTELPVLHLEPGNPPSINFGCCLLLQQQAAAAPDASPSVLLFLLLAQQTKRRKRRSTSCTYTATHLRVEGDVSCKAGEDLITTCWPSPRRRRVLCLLSLSKMYRGGRREKAQPFDHLVKLLVLGDSSVGKSSLLLRFAENKFDPNFVLTIGVDFKTKVVESGGRRIKLQVWDTAGQERFRTITPAYFRSAMGVMLVYDMTNVQTFNNIRRWMQDVEQFADPSIVRVLIANKLDLQAQRQVSRSKGEDLARAYDIPFLETSAKANVNVEEAFMCVQMHALSVCLFAAGPLGAAAEAPPPPTQQLTSSASSSRVRGVLLQHETSGSRPAEVLRIAARRTPAAAAAAAAAVAPAAFLLPCDSKASGAGGAAVKTTV
ncbi:hypothetical protein Efla_002464 [Eimeria flavescens]